MSWMIFEWMLKGKPSMLGAASGSIAGLVANTIDTIVNGTTYVVQSAVDTLSTAVADLLTPPTLRYAGPNSV